MGCCCKHYLSSATNVAVVYTVVNFIFFVFLDVFLIVCILFDNLFHSNNSSVGFQHLVLGLRGLKHVDVLWILLLVRLVIRLFWLLSTPALFIGNRLEKVRYMCAWQVFNFILILYTTVAAAYFLIVHYECGFLLNLSGDLAILSRGNETNAMKDAGKNVALSLLFVTLFETIICFYLPSVLFLILVHLRTSQINYMKREVRLLESWTSYELQPIRIPRAHVDGSGGRDPNTGISTISRTTGLTDLSRDSAFASSTLRLAANNRNSVPAYMPQSLVQHRFSASKEYPPSYLSKSRQSSNPYLYDNRAYECESESSSASGELPAGGIRHTKQGGTPSQADQSQQLQQRTPMSSSSHQSSTLKRVFL